LHPTKSYRALTEESDFAPLGTVRFRCDEHASAFLMHVTASQEGGSTISECLLAASRINRGDNDAWFREWRILADASRERAQGALQAGHLITARSNWLRAVGYYLAASRPLEEQDQRYQAAIGDMRFCAAQYLHYRRPRGEVVTVPCGSTHALEGYFLPASETNRPAPVVLCVGEPQQRKEKFLYKFGKYAAEREISLLALDFFLGTTGSSLAEDPERAISAGVDYLISRNDVDPDRIAILADEWGSSFVARAVGRDGRFAAAVCDGGIWELQERAFLRRWTADGRDSDSVESLRSNTAQALRCPVLITVGEEGWLASKRVASLVDRLKLDHPDITLRIFGQDETAAAQGHVDNPTLANEYIFDWITDQLGIVGR
jgi:Esterase FrsA-like